MFLIRVQVFQDPLGGELPRVQIFMNDWLNSLTWDGQLFSYCFSWNPAVFQDLLVNVINNRWGGHCFGSSRMRSVTGRKITTFKLGHPVSDSGIRWCMFPSVYAVMVLPVLQKAENLVTEQLLASQEGFCFMELVLGDCVLRWVQMGHTYFISRMY